MSIDMSSYNSDEIEDDPNDFSNLPEIPDDWYNVRILEAVKKITKDKQGEYLNLKLKIMDGDFDGRILFHKLQLKNATPLTVTIAEQSLKKIYTANNVKSISHEDDLIGMKFLGRVKRGKNYNGNPSYDIKGIKPIEGTVVAPIKQTAEAPKASVERPWDK